MSESLAGRLRELISALGVSQAAFAREIKVSPSFLTELLKGRSQASDRTLHTIAETFGANIQWLNDGEGEMFSGKSKGGSAAGLDSDLLRLVIEAVEQALDDLDLELKPAKKADLVVTLYEMYREDKKVDRATLIRLVKLAA